MNIEMKMNKTDALKKIDEIYEVIDASNRAFINGKKIAIYGVFIALVPLVNKLLIPFLWTYFSHPVIFPVLVTAIYFFAFYLLGVVLDRVFGSSEQEEESLHPILERAFSLYRPILYTLFACIAATAISKAYTLIWPIVFILMGLLYHLYGRFSHGIVRLVSWSYLILGVAGIAIFKRDIPYFHDLYNLYFAFSYILMGTVLFLSQKKSAQ